MENDLYTKAMFGEHAIHVPMWMKIQDNGEERGVIFVGASRSVAMRYGSNKTHQLIIGEMIIRPHVVAESGEFTGMGATGLLTEMDFDKWARGGIICDPLGAAAEKLLRYRRV